MQQPRVDQLDLVRIEMRRRPPEGREVEAFGQLAERGDRLDRLRCADPRQHVEQSHRLDSLLAQMLGAVGAKALRQFALGRDQQRLVRELTPMVKRMARLHGDESLTRRAKTENDIPVLLCS